MEIYRDSWHAKVYAFTRSSWAKFFYPMTYKDIGYYLNSPTNLCQYVRVLLLWLPLYITAILAFLSLLVYVLVIFPLKVVGIGSFSLFLFWSTATVLALIALAIGLIFLQKKYNYIDQITDFLAPEAKTEIDSKRISFFRLLKMRLADAHNKVCSVISFEGE